MKIINYRHDQNDITKLNDYIDTYYNIIFSDNNSNANRYLYFDIETTGLSAKNSTLYLIGALWYEDNTINIRQWFNDDGYCEKELIDAFNEFCSNFTHLVHFNGTTFDVPYIKEKAKKHSITINNIEKLIQLDIYKDIRSYKNLIGLANVKQVTIEKFLGIVRDDTYSGGELINVYQRYVARPNEDKEHLLLLHNHDDLLGMPGISNILRYKILFENPGLNIIKAAYDAKDSKLCIDIQLYEYCSFPKRLIYTSKDGIYINVDDNSATLIIPVISTKLKHFFKDYKNYYYLPAEDMAIHKSVSAYVSQSNRQRATKENCYITKEDSFILCPDSSYKEIFMNAITDKIYYRTIESLLNDTESKKELYVIQIIRSLKK